MILDIKLDENAKDFAVQLAGFQEIEVDFGQIHQITGGDVPVYSGAYSVDPRVAEQVLQTKGKMMQENLIVEKIPYFDVGNTSGGSTVYIGGE